MTFDSYNPEAPKDFAERAERHITVAKRTLGIEFGYDMGSILKLDDFIDAIGPPVNLGELVVALGSYLGEAFRHVYGGEWVWVPRLSEWAVEFPETRRAREQRPPGEGDLNLTGVAIFPFAKMAKRLTNGRVDSISYFTSVFSGQIRDALPR